MKQLVRFSSNLLFMIVVALSACAPVATPTPLPTYTPIPPTATSVPPTATSVPTATAAPSATPTKPALTATVLPSATLTTAPSATATKSPATATLAPTVVPTKAAVTTTITATVAAASSSAASATGTGTGKDVCLGCHGPYSKLTSMAPKFKNDSGELINPHRYDPHDKQGAANIIECLNCHTPHSIPPTAKVDLTKVNVDYCYSACHHQNNFTPCAACHQDKK